MRKKLIYGLILFASLAFVLAFTPPQSYMGFSAIKTADALIHTGPAYLYGIVVATDGTNSVTVKTYDNTTASGTQKPHPDWIVSTGAANRIASISFDPPVPMGTGIYVDITTSGTVSYEVYYRQM
jgi:hypothetical protein